MTVQTAAQTRRMADDLTDASTRSTLLQSWPSRVATMDWVTLNLMHELSQPLAAIANYVRAGQCLLADRQQPDLERLAAALDGAMTQSLHVGRVINGLRAFAARGEAGKAIESVATIVAQAVAVALPDAETHRIRLSLALDPAADRILVDRGQIEQVLVNLIGNAVEAMKDSPDRDLSVASVWEDGVVQISVTDSGSGVPPEVRDRLFEPFVTTRRNGTGLGLTICQAIVEAHGGTLWYEPVPDGGSAFRLTVTGVVDAPS